MRASRDRRAPPLATESPLPLLPSGSDGVHGFVIERDPAIAARRKANATLPSGLRGSNAAAPRRRAPAAPAQPAASASAVAPLTSAPRRRLVGAVLEAQRRMPGADAHRAEQMIGALDRRLRPVHAARASPGSGGRSARASRAAAHRPRHRPAPGRRRRSRRAPPPTPALRIGRGRLRGVGRRPRSRITSARGSKPGAQSAASASAPSRTSRARGTHQARGSAAARSKICTSPPPISRKPWPSGVGRVRAHARRGLLAAAHHVVARAGEIEQTPFRCRPPVGSAR